jgi:omega-amidase
MNITTGMLEKNIDHALKLGKNALANQPDLIVFPELFSTGYVKKDELQQVAEIIPGRTTKQLQLFARENHVAVAGSIIEKEVNDTDNYFNSLIFVNDSGEIRRKYKKIHLFEPMGEHILFQPGTEPQAVTTPFGTIGLMTCYDLRFPELARYLTLRQNSDTLLIVSEFPRPRQDHWKILLQARAIENQCFVIAVNRVGEDQNNSFFGLSMVVSPTGNILNALREDECVLTIDYNLKEVNAFREKIPSLRDSKLKKLFQ